MRGVLEALAEDLRLRGRFHLGEAFIDGNFALRKKRCRRGQDQAGKGTKIMAVADGTGLPVAVCAESATPHEVTLVQPLAHDLSRILAYRLLHDRLAEGLK